MSVAIHNINTNKSSVLQEKYKHTSRHVGEEKSETDTHCRLRGICKYTIQCHNTIQEYKSIQFNNTITTQADREVKRMAITSTHCRQWGRCNIQVNPIMQYNSNYQTSSEHPQAS